MGLSSAFALTCLAASVVLNGHAIPSLASLNSDVTILYNNDLDLTTANSKTSAILLSTPRSHADAVKACAVLGETLLPVNHTFFKQDLVPLLRYQTFLGTTSAHEQFWVADSGHACQNVNTVGDVSSSLCTLTLPKPVLCSQSAGFRAAAQPNTTLAVHSQDLTITGFRDQAAFKFFGIPYANPPARWEYPTAYTGNRTIDATRFGSPCVQSGSPSGSEDCLFLNIWTPFLPRPGNNNNSKDLKAIMFWIHGGAFTSGEGSDPTFEGGNMASRGDVVVVTLNYRLSTLGFLALPDGRTRGNFGIADQVAALDWVRAHARAFGGDPARITVFGQSAGAASVRALMASPRAIGKFAAAVPMSNLAGSNYAATYSRYFTIEEEVAQFADAIVVQAGCNGSADALACLRGVDAWKLVTLPTVARYVVVDGTFVTSRQLPVDGSAPIANVHTMMGFMRDDGAAFIGYPTSGNVTAGLTAQGLPTTVVGNPLFVEPAGSNATLNVFNVTARVATDVEFRCLDQAAAFSAVSHGLLKSVWFYEFNRSYQTPGFDPNFPTCEAPITPQHPLGDTSQEYFKCHSGELYYVWGTLPADRPYRDAEDLPFMQRMLDVWTAFGRTYDPNPAPAFLAARGFAGTAAQLAADAPWARVTKASLRGAPLRELQWRSGMRPFGEQAQCEFLGFPLTFYG